jgi:hypothetical protein
VVREDHPFFPFSNVAQHANIFIPDISGYTEFLTKTALDHSSHIINELLTSLVESNNSDLTLLEIEGDALLFFRKGEPIPFDRLVEQCRVMFTNFHTRLRTIERDTLCRCGACQKASHLTLKFIIHYGQISEIAVSSFVKASGIDMVIAHRLLKNRIDSSEYILATEDYLRRQEIASLPSGYSWRTSDEEYPVVGKVQFRYASLEDVKNSIPPVPESETEPSCVCDQVVSITVASPLMNVYEVMIDLDGRKEWIEGIQESSGEDPLGRLHSRHYCTFGDGTVEVTPLYRRISDTAIDYSESIRIEGSDIPGATAYFRMVKADDGLTRIEARVGGLSGEPLPKDIAGYHLQTIEEALQGLKRYCESRQAIPVSH